MKKLLAGVAASVFLGGLIFVPMKDHLQQVWAAPEEVKEVKEDQDVLREQTKIIGEYVQQKIKEDEFTEEQKRKAPPGWQWNPIDKEYTRVKK